MTVSVLRFYCQLIIVGALQEALQHTVSWLQRVKWAEIWEADLELGAEGEGVKFGTDTHTKKIRETKTKTQKVSKIRMEFRII